MHTKPNVGRIMRSATLRQLQVFEALARLNSFTRVAEEMHLTQPTISMQVKKLAEVVDLPLTEQVGKEVYLTEAGEELASVCRDVLRAFENLEENINNLKGLEGGKVRIAVVSTAQYFVPQVMLSFAEQYPNITVELEVVNREQLFERLSNNQDDIYILGQPSETIPVVSERLAVNPLVFVAKRDINLPEERILTAEDIADIPFLMREVGSGIRAQIEQVFADIGYRPNVRTVLGSNEAIRMGVLSGLGISVVSLHTVKEELRRRELRILPIKGFPIERHWYLAWPKGKTISLSAARFIETLKFHAMALDAGIKPLLAKVRKEHTEK